MPCSSKIATNRLKACNVFRKEIVQISHKNFSKRPFLQNSCGSISVLQSFLNKAAGINSSHANLLKRSFHQGGLPVNTSKFLSGSLKMSHVSSVFCKTTSFVLLGHNLMKTIVQQRLLSNSPFKAGSTQIIYLKNPVMKSAYCRVVVCKLQAFRHQNKLLSYIFS